MVEEEDGYLAGHDTDDYNVIIFPPSIPPNLSDELGCTFGCFS